MTYNRTDIQLHSQLHKIANQDQPLNVVIMLVLDSWHLPLQLDIDGVAVSADDAQFEEAIWLV